MKRTVKMVMTFGSFCVASSLLGSIVFADTATTPTPNASTTQLKSQLKADRNSVKVNEQQDKQLTAQVKSAEQAWKMANPNPFKALSADQQSSVKSLRSDMNNTQANLKSDNGQLKSLRAQLKAAKEAKQSTSVQTLKGQIQTLVGNIKSDHTELQADKQKIEAILPAGTMKAFHDKEVAFKTVLKPDESALKASKQQLKSDEQTLKADRGNKDWSKVDQDLQSVNHDLGNIISEKQQLLSDISKVSSIAAQA